MRGRELEARTDDHSGAPTPLYGPTPYAPSGTAYNRPLWLEVGTPRTLGDTPSAVADRVWFFVSWPLRALCIAIMLMTYRWYYVAGVAVTVGFLLYLITSTP